MPRVIVISGEPSVGKTFRLSVLSAMLPDSEHLKIQLDAATISTISAVDVAEAVCKAAGADPPPFMPLTEAASGQEAWLRSEILPKTMAALESSRAGRIVWLSIAELNKSEIQDESASALLFLFCEQTCSTNWLRVVLDGMKGDLPLAARPLAAREHVQPINEEDLRTYVRRALAQMGLAQNEAAVDNLVATAVHAGTGWMTALSSALHALSEEQNIQTFVEAYPSQLSPGATE